MAEYLDREHFIPIRLPELVDFLVTGRGSTEPQSLPADQAEDFRRFAKLLEVHYTNLFRDQMAEVSESYAPFDPDADTVPLVPMSDSERDQLQPKFYESVRHLLEKANYRLLPRENAAELFKGRSFWGLDMHVNWDIFDHIEIYYRGDTVGTREIRKWYRLWFPKTVKVEQYSRLVVMLKLKPNSRYKKYADTNSVYLKMLKDMPKMDIEMVMPGTRIRLTKLDKGLIVYPIASGVGLILYKVLTKLLGIKDYLALGTSISLTWGLAAMFAGYSYKSFISYTNKKTAYTLQLTQNLYYQGIDNNAGVFHRLFIEAMEQEIREAMLAYYYLWKTKRTLTEEQLDDLVEEELERQLKMKVDFEISDAIQKLENLHLVEKDGYAYRAIPMEKALQQMDKLSISVHQ
ncbi:MAG: DUF3754 domain-containing protein [Zavarzinella sp.]